ncbi:MAG: type II toxin-antitoxin system RelE/ParE family toxin [Candidatus Gracilibacteria bacterium]
MAYFKAIYTNEAQADLGRLERVVRERIVLKINDILKMENPLFAAKKLKNLEIPHYRFRVGDYRVIFKIDRRTGEIVILVIVKVEHRKDVYKQKA